MRWLGLAVSAPPADGQGMTTHDLVLASTHDASPAAGPLDRAVAAHLTRFTGSSRQHARSDLRCSCPGAMTGAWTRSLPGGRTRSSTSGGCKRSAASSHRPSPGGSRSPRASAGPSKSPTLGFTHLQFEAMLTASRESANPCDFALVAMLGLLGLRIFEATSANIADLGEEHGHRVLRVCGTGTKVVLIPLPPARRTQSTAPSVAGLRARSCSTSARPGWTGTPSSPSPASRAHQRSAHRPHPPAHAAAHVRHHDARRRSRPP